MTRPQGPGQIFSFLVSVKTKGIRIPWREGFSGRRVCSLPTRPMEDSNLLSDDEEEVDEVEDVDSGIEVEEAESNVEA